MAARSVKRRRRGKTRARRHSAPRRVRYAVVGLGWIAQESILPAFARARQNSELHALVSDDPAKLRNLGRKYGVTRLYSYDDYESCLRDVDAVFIALPNSHVARNGDTRTTNFPARDQFAPEVLHFSDAILRNRKPAPSGDEGLRDVRVLAAIERSARRGRPVKLARIPPGRRPRREQETHRPAGGTPRLVRADDPRPD